jgi:transcriptional regulator with XRE-family HTH domain
VRESKSTGLSSQSYCRDTKAPHDRAGQNTPGGNTGTGTSHGSSYCRGYGSGTQATRTRKSRRLSQSELERRAGLLRCYTSRVENGHTVPGVETIEKYAIPLGIPLAEFFLTGPRTPAAPLPSSELSKWRSTPRARLQNEQLAAALVALKNQDRQLFVALAQRLTRRNQMKRRKPGFRAA